MADAVGLWVIVYFCVTSVNKDINVSLYHCISYCKYNPN